VKESLLSTVIETVKDQLGSHKYYPLLLTLFLFILISNFLGMVPYSFTPTSHLIVTVGLSFPIMLGVTIIGLKNYKSEFFALFLPAGTPTALIPLLTAIEFISYIARAFSLGIRLFANILSGHALLHILAGFTYKFVISDAFFILKFAPIIFIAVLLSLEIAIAFLQAYVFTVLTASYLKDVI
jgi:F-type H+-transporting ATPase subunit a